MVLNVPISISSFCQFQTPIARTPHIISCPYHLVHPGLGNSGIAESVRTLQVPSRFSTGTLPLQYKYPPASVQLPSRFSAATGSSHKSGDFCAQSGGFVYTKQRSCVFNPKGHEAADRAQNWLVHSERPTDQNVSRLFCFPERPFLRGLSIRRAMPRQDRHPGRTSCPLPE